MSTVSFLDWNHSFVLWQQLSYSFNLRLKNGLWIDSYTRNDFKPLYTQPCVDEHPAILRYVSFDCLRSSSSVGRWYTWRPFDEDLQPFDPAKMCLVMNGRTLMFAGDSMQYQFYFAFVSAVLKYTVIHQDRKFPSTEFMENNSATCSRLCEWTMHDHNCERPLVIDCGDSIPPFSVLFARTNMLDVNDGPWLRLITKFNVSLIFLNTGAHYQSDENLLHNIDLSLRYIYENHPSMSVIYRNTYHGHDDCHLFYSSPPLSSGLHHIHSFEDQQRVHPEWGWQHFDRQNELVHALLTESFPQVLYLDVATSTQLRVDSHVSKEDCYHYCLPGPVDEWVVFHLNALWIIFEHHIASNSAGIGMGSYLSTTPLPEFNDGTIADDSVILNDGDIVVGQPILYYGVLIMSQSKFLIVDGEKRYVADEDFPIFARFLNKSIADIKTIPNHQLHQIPTRRWQFENS